MGPSFLPREKFFTPLLKAPMMVGSARPRLTKETGIPFYRQIQHLIRHRIASGEYQPGTQIPSENELCRLLNVSRMTLREALVRSASQAKASVFG